MADYRRKMLDVKLEAVDLWEDLPTSTVAVYERVLGKSISARAAHAARKIHLRIVLRN